MGCKKKLYELRPRGEQIHAIEIHHTKQQRIKVAFGKADIEREFRQMLSDKINGTHMGLWLLLPQHLRLGSWELLKAWNTESDDRALEPRLGMQMVHESALCIAGIRQQRTLRQRGFETLNGLPFVASDPAIHELLDKRTMNDAAIVQTRLGMLRRALKHYEGTIVLVDPHRIHTWSKRQFAPRKSHFSADAQKKIQTFFAIDAHSGQPYTFGMGSTSITATQATMQLVKQLENIIRTEAIIVGDAEHFTTNLFKEMKHHPQFSLLVPAARRAELMGFVRTLEYQRQWAGYAVAESEYQFGKQYERLLVQRTGERAEEYEYKPFLTTDKRDAAHLMATVFPERWNIEEFFKTEENLGWNRAATLNMHIRYNRLTMALIAQAAIYELRKKLPANMNAWTAECMAEKLFSSIDGDIRVHNDTIVVTLYDHDSQLQSLRSYYEDLPKKLEREGIDPRVPWLYGYKVDFRFR
jgi:hypothetical protein